MAKKTLDTLSDNEYKGLERRIILGSVIAVGLTVFAIAGWKKVSNPPASLATFQDSAKLLSGAKLVSGDPDAGVTVVEFFDYQCPACRMLRPAFEKQLQASSVKHSFYVQNMPLAQHPYARDLAVIATSLSGAEFQEFHQAAYAGNSDALPKLITSWSDKLTKRDPDFVDKGLDEVKVSEAAGQAAKVIGTPTVFVVDKPHHRIWQCTSASTVGDTLNMCQ